VKARTIILFLVIVLIVLVLTPVLLICFLIQARWPILAAGKGGVALARALLGIRVTVIGRRPELRKTQYIFMANHLSFVDGPLLYWIIPGKVRVILKREIFRIPVVGLGMRFLDFIPVDRKGLKGGKRSLDLAAHYMARKSYSYLVFPEGTRSLDGRLQAFKRGGFFLALKSGVPIVPMTVQGTFAMMPKGSFFIRKGAIRVTFHPPIPVEGYQESELPILIDKVRQSIASSLTEEEKPPWTTNKTPKS
jgi:1-acyl-sn-glycerol-3-phosphate acyltransferase